VRRGAALLALAVLAALTGCGEPAAQPGPPSAPDFDLPLLRGGRVSLDSLSGHIAVVDFWATWCAPCVKQIPVLNAIEREFGDRVAVLGIATDAAGAKVVDPFVRENGIAYRVPLGNMELARRYGAPGLPTLAVISPDGRIARLHVGNITYPHLAQTIEALLAR